MRVNEQFPAARPLRAIAGTDIETEIPKSVFDAIESWGRILANGRSENARQNLLQAAIELWRLNRATNAARPIPTLHRTVGDALYAMAVTAGIEDNEAQVIIVEGQTAPPDRTESQSARTETDGFHSNLSEGPDRRSRPIVATPYNVTDPTQIRPRDWLYARHYIRRYVSATIAPGGMGKTSLALAEAVAMCTGRNLLGQPVRDKLRVWFWSGEDPLEEVERRLAAICLHYDVSNEEIGGRLFINSGRDFPMRIASMHRAELVFDQAIIAALTGELQRKHIDVLTIDPLVSSHGVPENDNTNIDRVIKEGFAAIANSTNAAIDLLHHVRKASSDQTSYTVDDARGASAIIGAVRSARVLNSMTSAQAGAAGLDEGVRRQYFRLEDGKANMSPLSARPRWFHLASVALGNMTETMPEDFVGVVVPFEMPSAFDRVQVDDVRKVQQRIAAATWAFHPSAANWAGIAVGEVLELNPADSAGKAKISALLSAWISSGALRVTLQRNTERGRDQRMIVVGAEV